MSPQSAPSAPPAELVAEVRAELSVLPRQEQSMFLLRLDRWWEPLLSGLRSAYADPESLARRSVHLAVRAYVGRSEDLRERDLRRLVEPDWFQRSDMVGYAAYAERFGGPRGLAGIGQRIDYLTAVGVTYLHLMPLLQPRPEPNDGGYAVADYRTVREDLGTMDDLRELTGKLHDAGISLCLDLVLNHVAREHEWAQRARAGEPAYRDYFYVYPDRTEPDAYEATLPEVFPAFAPGNFTWDDDLDGWVWTTFNSYQWDLNWTNPEVFAEMLDTVLFLANAGVDVLRLDAIAFIWKRLGTNSQNQPEVHAITQALRAVVRLACPGVLFLAEAIVSPGDLVHYLGKRQHHGRLSDLAYHNSLMVQLWSMLATGKADLGVAALRAMPAIPSSTSWLTYVRCHDDIGWAVDDHDAASVGLDGYLHRAFLSDWYAGTFPGSFADGLVFQDNPATGDRRISGSAASLAGLSHALRAGDLREASAAIARVLLGYALMAFWGGVPVIWYGDEIAVTNDEQWSAEPDHAEDNRWAHRPVLSWPLAHLAVASETPPAPMTGSLVGQWPQDEPTKEGAVLVTWHGLQRVLRTRKALVNLHAASPTEVLGTPHGAVLAVRREHPLGTALGLFNVGRHHASVPSRWLAEHGADPAAVIDVLSGSSAPEHDRHVQLPPYGVLWLVERSL